MKGSIWDPDWTMTSSSDVGTLALVRAQVKGWVEKPGPHRL